MLRGLLGKIATDREVESAFIECGTLTRPSLDEDDEDQHYDWVLVRRKGDELGFVDAAYFRGEIKPLWRSEGLILNQLTFYSDTRGSVKAYEGKLPHGLSMHDTRATVREKLISCESTRRSYLTDRWDIENYRLIVAYKPNDAGVDSVHIKLPIWPYPQHAREQPTVAADEWLSLFGEPQNSETLQLNLTPLNIVERIEEDEDEREVSFTDACGITLYFEEARRIKLPALRLTDRTLVFSAVKFFRARDQEARQYSGALPLGLDFNDSPETLLKKLGRKPDKHDDGSTTGRALWHFQQFSLQVLYSTLENHLFRIMLMAPGYWHEFGELDD